MSGANLIVGFTYAYDNEGNKFYEQKLHELGRSEAYMYDSVYRLVNYQAGTLSSSPPPNCPAGALGVPDSVTQTAYSLDKLGNWNSKTTDGVPQTRTHSPSNEITSINGASVASDFDGNTTMYGPSGYRYDEEQRLTEATFGPHNIALGQYQYDAFGRRVSKIDNLGNQTPYYYDGWRTIEEQSSAGVTQATYVFGNYLDEALTIDRGGHTYYYHQNALWSVFALTDSSGAGVEGYYYDPYGYQTVVLPGPDGKLDFDSDDDYSPGARSSVGNPFLFTSQRFDPETGLLYYKHRYNSTFVGRFVQRDPVDYVSGNNLYEYAFSNPVNYVDISGLDVTSTPNEEYEYFDEYVKRGADLIGRFDQGIADLRKNGAKEEDIRELMQAAEKTIKGKWENRRNFANFITAFKDLKGQKCPSPEVLYATGEDPYQEFVTHVKNNRSNCSVSLYFGHGSNDKESIDKTKEALGNPVVPEGEEAGCRAPKYAVFSCFAGLHNNAINENNRVETFPNNFNPVSNLSREATNLALAGYFVQDLHGFRKELAKMCRCCGDKASLRLYFGAEGKLDEKLPAKQRQEVFGKW